MTPAIRTAAALAAAVPFLLVGIGPTSAGPVPTSTADLAPTEDPVPEDQAGAKRRKSVRS